MTTKKKNVTLSIEDFKQIAHGLGVQAEEWSSYAYDSIGQEKKEAQSIRDNYRRIINEIENQVIYKWEMK
jgi:cupin superfamily acireductone dioxygenase involved in methionine salvage